MRYWLVKSDFEDYSISDFKKDKKTLWTGVRNFQARNYMTQGMEVGDMVLFYHSNGSLPGVAGLGKVSTAATVDPTQFDTADSHFDPKSKKEKPLWYCVELAFVSAFNAIIPISRLREIKGLAEMVILQRGNRLSVTPVTKKEYEIIIKLSENT